MRRKEASRGAVPKRAVRRELLKIEGRAVEVQVKLNPRARRLIVKVHPASGEVSVIAPSRRSLEHALDFARGQTAWIARQLAHVPSRVLLTDGARIPFRGKEHVVAGGGQGPVSIEDGTAVIRVGGRAEHAPRRLLDFLRRQAKRELEARAGEFAARIGARVRRVTVRDTASRWGSCSSTRSLSFSWRLILAPAFVLDYVAAHEVAHLKEMNHGPDFWRLVRELVGDVKRPQAWLRQHGPSLHRYGAK